MVKFNNIDTNLGGASYEKLLSGIWKIGLIKDNEGIADKTSRFYEDKESENTSYRSLRNKVGVRLLDSSFADAHIIHWCPVEGYFCVTFDTFWDKFDE